MARMKFIALIVTALVIAQGAAAKTQKETRAHSRNYVQSVAMQILKHCPATTKLGPGTATVRIHVANDGVITALSARGSSPEHAALGKQIVSSVKAPPPPGGVFEAEQEFKFH